jgi:NAD(P)-dependent dehydrogenase (short-subunit alcohol dehydrogenase family)
LVNEVAPGYVDAGLSKTIWAKNLKLYQKSRRKVPLRKLIHPEEVAAQVIHLCDPKNQHMTGSTLLMDGGLSLLC